MSRKRKKPGSYGHNPYTRSHDLLPHTRALQAIGRVNDVHEDERGYGKKPLPEICQKCGNVPHFPSMLIRYPDHYECRATKACDKRVVELFRDLRRGEPL